MILYRITRYGPYGKDWVRYSKTKHRFGAVKGEIKNYRSNQHDRVTLEEMTIPEENIKMVEDFYLSAEERAKLDY